MLSSGCLTEALESVRAVHVSGFSHTGTTLLVNIIRNNPEVCSITSEHNFFTFLTRIRRMFRKTEDNAVLRRYLEFLYSTLRHGAYRMLKGHVFEDDEKGGFVHRAFSNVSHQGPLRKDHVGLFYSVVTQYCLEQGKTVWVGKLNPRFLDRIRPED